MSLTPNQNVTNNAIRILTQSTVGESISGFQPLVQIIELKNNKERCDVIVFISDGQYYIPGMVYPNLKEIDDGIIVNDIIQINDYRMDSQDGMPICNILSYHIFDTNITETIGSPVNISSLLILPGCGGCCCCPYEGDSGGGCCPYGPNCCVDLEEGSADIEKDAGQLERERDSLQSQLEAERENLERQRETDEDAAALVAEANADEDAAALVLVAEANADAAAVVAEANQMLDAAALVLVQEQRVSAEREETERANSSRLSSRCLLINNKIYSGKITNADAAALVAEANADASAPISCNMSSSLASADNCVICQVTASSQAIIPCGHYCLCDDCAATLTSGPSESQVCPLCRTRIQRYLKIYQSKSS